MSELINNLFPAGAFVDYARTRWGDSAPFSLEVYNSEAEWLKGREGRIGASSVGAVLGLTDQWQTRRELFDIMTGAKEKTFTGNEFTRRGKLSEPHIRALFAIDNPRMDIYDGTGMIFVSKADPWRSCSLDAIAVSRESEEVFVVEIKTGIWNRKWKGDSVPDAYVAQMAQQLEITSFRGAYLVARLQSPDDEIKFASRAGMERVNFYDAEDDTMAANIAYVKKEVNEFWDSVQNGRFRTKINLAI